MNEQDSGKERLERVQESGPPGDSTIMPIDVAPHVQPLRPLVRPEPSQRPAEPASNANISQQGSSGGSSQQQGHQPNIDVVKPKETHVF